MKILFLDDNEFRHKKMRQNSIGFSVSHVFTAQEAIEQMRTSNFDLIMLDHDLDNSTQNELNDEEEDGRFVTRWMAQEFKHTDVTVVIHSLNYEGAISMFSILSSAGFSSVHVLPGAWTMIEKTEEGGASFGSNTPVRLDDYREA